MFSCVIVIFIQLHSNPAIMSCSSEPAAGHTQSLKMNDTLGNGTNSSISVIYMPLAITDLTINFILILPSNIYVLWLILSGAGGTIVSEFFYLNVTVSLVISTLDPVFYFVFRFTQNSTFELVAHFIFVLFFWFSVPSFQCCICVERYIAVVHPVVFLRYKALRYRVACCCVVWLMVFALSLFLFVSLTVMCYVFLGFCIVCIAVVSFCCLSVLRALRQPGPGEGQKRDSGQGNDMKSRAFRIILISLVVMLVSIVSCIPFALSLSPVILIITCLLVRVSGSVHPLLYIHKAGKLPCFKGL